jgi:hypothetical protein
MDYTDDDLDNLFGYHAPNEITGPKYAAIREAEQAAREIPSDATHDDVSVRTRAFAAIVVQHCPDSPARDAAVEWISLARNAMNEIVAANDRAKKAGASIVAKVLDPEASLCLRRARWKACAAIACHRPWQGDGPLRSEAGQLMDRLLNVVHAATPKHRAMIERLGTFLDLATIEYDDHGRDGEDYRLVRRDGKSLRLKARSNAVDGAFLLIEDIS